MKYLAIKNMYLFKKNLFKYYYLNILVLLISLFQHHSILSYLREEEIFSVLGLGSLYENNPIYILLKIISISVVIHFTFKSIFFDMFNDIKNLILRMDLNKIILTNFVNCLFLILFTRIFINVIAYLIFLILNIKLSVSFILIVLLKDISFYVIVFNLTVLFMLFIYSNSNIKYISVIVSCALILLITKSLYKINMLIMFLIMIVIMIINLLLICKTGIFKKILNE